MDFNFLGLVNRVLAMAGKTTVITLSDSVADDDYQVQMCVNDTLQDLSNILRIKTRLANFSFDTIAGQRVYAIPRFIKFPIIDLRQEQTATKLEFIDTPSYDMYVPKDNSSGDPLFYYIEGNAGVENQPNASDMTINFLAGTASDNSKVIVQGYNSSGVYKVLEVTLAGLTQVSTNYWDMLTMIEKITKPRNTEGSAHLQVSTDSVSNILYLDGSETTASFITIGLYPIPDKAITIYGRGYYKIPSLYNDNETPLGFDENCINAIIAGAYARYMKYDPKYMQEGMEALWGAYNNEILKIIDNDMRNPDQQVRFKSSRESSSKLNWARPINRYTI